MKKAKLILLSLLFQSSILMCQEMTVYFSSLSGIMSGNSFNAGNRGLSFGLDYLNPISHDFKWLVGGELNSVSWGNNAFANIGVNYSKPFSNKWSWSLSISTQQGISLFKPKMLYTFGFSSKALIIYCINYKSSLALGTGLKYYDCPAYSNYSFIHHYLDLPIELSYIFSLK
jgi:hypothetical protein